MVDSEQQAQQAQPSFITLSCSCKRACHAALPCIRACQPLGQRKRDAREWVGTVGSSRRQQAVRARLASSRASSRLAPPSAGPPADASTLSAPSQRQRTSVSDGSPRTATHQQRSSLLATGAPTRERVRGASRRGQASERRLGTADPRAGTRG